MSTDSVNGQNVESEERRTSPSPELLRRELEGEFNIQRAKMKELFLQKEEEARRMLLDRQQMESEVAGLRAELEQLQNLSQNQKSEIQSLQLLVNETVEESSSGTEELRRLTFRNHELEQQLNILRQQQQDVSAAPAQLVRSLARKLGADTEDQARKQAIDENELMRSVMDPLEQELVALKNKLRDTDAQLQEALKEKLQSAANSGGDTKSETVADGSRRCDMCQNYEKQLVCEQRQSEAAKERAATLQKAMSLASEELEGVRSLHDETVRSWRSQREAAAQQLQELQAAVAEARQLLRTRAEQAQRAAQEALDTVTTLTVQREMLQGKLAQLERDNAVLVGQYAQKAEEMQNEPIDLPNEVEPLQELALHLTQQLITCQLGREKALTECEDMRLQVMEQGSKLHALDDELGATRLDLRKHREMLEQLQAEREQMKELGDKLRQSNVLIETLLDDKKRFQSEVSEYRLRVSVLQQDLDNSEKVQQDFVRLSQSLQMQLQSIREAESEVRWQHDEDVSECPACRVALSNPKKKVHCRHCGRVFCGGCVSGVVPAGPRRAPARVCQPCRALLTHDGPPFYATMDQ